MTVSASTLAKLRPLSFALSFALFIAISFYIVAPFRSLPRLASITSQLGAFKSSLGQRPLTTAAMAPAKFKQPPQAPPLFTGTPESVIKDTKEMLASSKKVIDEIVANTNKDNATFANVLLPMAQDENKQTLAAHILGFYQSVSTDPKLRDASTEAEKLMDEYGIEIGRAHV